MSEGGESALDPAESLQCRLKVKSLFEITFFLFFQKTAVWPFKKSDEQNLLILGRIFYSHLAKVENMV